MNYTAESDIEAMAEGLARAKHDLSKFDNPQALIDSYKDDARLMIAASTVHAEYGRLKAESERMREENEAMKQRLKPEWWYTEDGESAGDAIDLAEYAQLHDGYMKVFGAAEVCVNYVAHIILTRDDDGDPEETEFRVFDTEEEAKQALQQKGGEDEHCL